MALPAADNAAPRQPGFVSPAIATAAAQIRQRFAAATPFRHVCIDNFLSQAAARDLAGEDDACT
jgi:hypothetical protein